MKQAIRSLLLLGVGLSAACNLTPPQEEDAGLSVLTWNIWHGGREDGEEVGPQRVIEVIRNCGADLVAMQETYGSGEIISTGLDFHFHPRGTNVSIHSRFPIVADISVYEEFKCVGAVVELPTGERVAFLSVWLPYDAEIWEVGTREGRTREELLAACASSATNLEQIMAQLEKRLDELGMGDLPMIIAGDFNSMSHLDYTEEAHAQYGHVIDWPTSRVMSERGFRDGYRSLHPQVDRARDRTWTPRFPKQQQDRIDFVYDTLREARVAEARVIDEHASGFPSDHAALFVCYAGQSMR